MSTEVALPTHAELLALYDHHQHIDIVARTLGIDPRSCNCADYNWSYACFFINTRNSHGWINNIVEQSALHGLQRNVHRLQRLINHHRQELGPTMVAHLENHIAAMLLQAAL